MILLLSVALLGAVAEGADLRRQFGFLREDNSSQPAFPPGFSQFQGQGLIPTFPGGSPQFPQPPAGLPFQPPQQLFPQPAQQPSRFFSRPDVRLDTSSPVPIIKLDIQPNLGDGKYSYSYETGDGIKAEEKGEQKEVGGEPNEPGTVAAGSYSYTDPDGNLVSLTYTADENGFVPQGAHLPVAPPVPQEILDALEKNAAEEAAANNGNISPAFHVFFRNSYRHRNYY